MVYNLLLLINHRICPDGLLWAVGRDKIMDKGYPIDVNKEMKRYKTIELFGDEVMETFFKEGNLVQVTRKMTESEKGGSEDDETCISR